MSPLWSQLALLAIVAIPVGIGFYIEARRKRRVEDALALQQIRAAKALQDEATTPTAKSLSPLRDAHTSRGL